MLGVAAAVAEMFVLKKRGFVKSAQRDSGDFGAVDHHFGKPYISAKCTPNGVSRAKTKK